METQKMLKCQFPCGDLLYFNYDSETMDEDTTKVYFKEPFFRCPKCIFENIMEDEDGRLCPANVCIVEMSDEDIKRELVQVSKEEDEVEETNKRI